MGDLFQACKACRIRKNSQFWQGPQQAKRCGPSMSILAEAFTLPFLDGMSEGATLGFMAERIVPYNINNSAVTSYSISLGSWNTAILHITDLHLDTGTRNLFGIPIFITPNIQNLQPSGYNLNGGNLVPLDILTVTGTSSGLTLAFRTGHYILHLNIFILS